MKKAIEKKAYSAAAVPAKKTSIVKPKKTEEVKSLKKQYLKSDNICKVTFRLPKEAANGAQVVTIVGDFNDWNTTESRMKRLKNGDFTLTLPLACNREYRFRYLIDSNRWENDWCAEKYVPNNFGTEDSVVAV
jgi:1,4-alpha-glucan branching enzyme